MPVKLSDSNKVKFYNFIVDYETSISDNFGHYNIDDPAIVSFCEDNKILLGSDCTSNDKRISQYKFYILWDNRKPDKYKNYKGNDTAHNLLRHIRNSMAHGNLSSVNRQKFNLADYNSDHRQTMRGKISCNLFFDLLDIIQKTYS